MPNEIENTFLLNLTKRNAFPSNGPISNGVFQLKSKQFEENQLKENENENKNTSKIRKRNEECGLNEMGAH